ncbi:MAG: hypothetical protein ACI8RZ_007986 [Myxococcota bacterium]|jgi:hypothetical protein
MPALLTLLAFLPVHAATLEGVTLPDSATIGGQSVVLNGIGLREKYMLDIYVAGLYLTATTANAEQAITQDSPKRIVMQMVRDLTQEQLADSIRESAGKQNLSAEAKTGITQLSGWMTAVSSGQQVVLDYVPGQGTSLTIGGSAKGTAAGVETMQAIWRIYLGDPPVTANLKAGLLGG